jgi:hypothetical protein
MRLRSPLLPRGGGVNWLTCRNESLVPQAGPPRGGPDVGSDVGSDLGSEEREEPNAIGARVVTLYTPQHRRKIG